MERAVLAAIFTVAASTSYAQTTDGGDGAGPANLCQELLAFVKEHPDEQVAASAAPAAKMAAEADAPKDAGTTNAESEDAAPASDKGLNEGEDSQSSQDVTGQEGPATDAPDPDVEPEEGGKAEDAPQKASVSAPVPTDGESVSKLSVVSVAEAEELAGANDISACKATVRKLRLAGVAVPSPLLALGALDLQYQSTTKPEAPGTLEAPASQPEAD